LKRDQRREEKKGRDQRRRIYGGMSEESEGEKK